MLTEKDWMNSIRNERRRKRRAAFHEVGHALAMYLCYGNIDRIDKIIVRWNGSGYCNHENPMEYYDYLDFIDGDDITTGNLFNEVCYSVGGGLCEAMFCNKVGISFITGNKKYKFPIKGMKDDLEHIRTILSRSYLRIKDERDIEAFIRMAVIRLRTDFLIHADKIRQCVDLLLKEDDVIERYNFYSIFDDRLYKKELARLRRERKERRVKRMM